MPPEAEAPTVVEFPIRRRVVLSCCFLIMLLGMATALVHEIERIDEFQQDVHPRSARDTFFTVGVAMDVLSVVFLFLWTWVFSPFRSKRLFQLLPLFLLPGCLCLVAILAWEAHGVSRPESLGIVQDADAPADAPAYYRGPFQIAALVGVALMLGGNLTVIISVFVYTYDCRYCAFYDHSVYRYGNMKFQVRRISTARAALAATTVV